MHEPSAGLYVAHVLGFALRYFAIAGGLYGLFFVVGARRWRRARVQEAPLPAGDVAHDVRWSLLSSATTGLSMLLTAYLVHAGHTRVYLDPLAHGWAYLGGSAVLCLVGYDSWLYWQHRLLHTRWLFTHVHGCHHYVTNPSPFSAFSQHPIETLMGNLYFVLFTVLVPVNPLAVALAGGYMYLAAFLGHSGVEFFPRGFTSHRVLGWLNTSTHHNMHHSEVGCNYSVCLNLWDWAMGTNHQSYHARFDAIAARRRSQPASPVTASEVVGRAA
jgi:sterol desaturase/sphingolipid hydroxylase (fatty acid hydroxylase superfamily)